MRENPYDNKFIAIEGIDGSGKSSLLEAAYERLADKYDIRTTAEPYQQQTRYIVSKRDMSDVETAAVFSSDRHLHNRERIELNLEYDSHVITDRYAYSSFAYQGDNEITRQLNENVLKPDAVIWIDCDLATALQRVGERDEIVTQKDADNMANANVYFMNMYHDSDEIDFRIKNGHYRDFNESVDELVETIEGIINE